MSDDLKSLKDDNAPEGSLEFFRLECSRLRVNRDTWRGRAEENDKKIREMELTAKGHEVELGNQKRLVDFYIHREESFRSMIRTTCRVAAVVVVCVTLVAGAYLLGERRGVQTSPADRNHLDQLVSQPRNAAAEEMPAETLATLCMFNGSTQCSATVLTRGPEYGLCIGCGHCFTGVIGGKFWVYRPDGHATWAQLLAIEHAEPGDLSLFRIPADDVLETAPLWEGERNPKTLVAIGYPSGVGPRVTELGNVTIGQGEWHFPLVSGKIVGGSSGSGVFADGRTCGVIAGWRGNQVRTGCTHEAIDSFLFRCRNKLRGCRDGICRIPPPDGADESLPPAPPPEGPAPAWKPNPQAKLPAYQGKIPMPDKESTKRIIDLEKRLATLQAMIDAMATQTPPPGEQGPRGLPGPAGRDGPPGSVDPAALAKAVDDAVSKLSPATGNFDPSGLQKQIDDLSKAIAAIKPGTPTDLSGIQSQIAVIQGTLAAGIKVQILDSTKTVVDEDTYPINGPIKIQKITKSSTQGVASNGK